MLGLKLLTDPRWADIAERNLEEILTDHAWCEQKAATNAITMIAYNSEHDEFIQEMSDIAIEEMQHFKMVVEIIQQRGYTLGRERKDDYVAKMKALDNDMKKHKDNVELKKESNQISRIKKKTTS